MRKFFKDKKIIKITICVLFLTFIITISVFTLNNKNNTNKNIVIEATDGTKINNSPKIKKTKTFDEMKINGIKITEKDGVTLLIGTITNTSKEEKGDYGIALKVVDKDGNELTIAHGYIKLLKPGETTELNISKTFDYSNAYDFTIEKEQ